MITWNELRNRWFVFRYRNSKQYWMDYCEYLTEEIDSKNFELEDQQRYVNHLEDIIERFNKQNERDATEDYISLHEATLDAGP